MYITSKNRYLKLLSLLLVPGLDELLRRLEVLEGDALRRPPRLPHQLRVRLPLRLRLVVSHRRNVRPRKNLICMLPTMDMELGIWTLPKIVLYGRGGLQT